MYVCNRNFKQMSNTRVQQGKFSEKKKKKKRLVLVAVEGLLYFVFWKKNVRTLFVLFGKGIETKVLISFSCLINLPVCYKYENKVYMLLNKYD